MLHNIAGGGVEVPSQEDKLLGTIVLLFFFFMSIVVI